jgi:hypothetical protein
MARYTADFIERKFKGISLARANQKRNGDKRYSGDAGYWDGGRCNYGAAHNLQEDCQRLASFFTEITELRNVRKELINFTNQEEFEKIKQDLIVKTERFLNGLNMKTGSSTSIGGVCIIWADFAEFFNSMINDFRKELEMLKRDIEVVAYNEIKELKKLEADERKLQKEIEENERKARNEPDKDKARKFVFLADQAKDKWKKILSRKKELKSSRLGDNFDPDSHIDNFLKIVEDKLTGKNKPQRPAPHQPKPRQSSTNFNNSNSNNSSSQNPYSNTNPSSIKEEKTFFQNYWKEIVFFSIFLIGAYYIYNQPNNHEKTN